MVVISIKNMLNKMSTFGPNKRCEDAVEEVCDLYRSLIRFEEEEEGRTCWETREGFCETCGDRQSDIYGLVEVEERVAELVRRIGEVSDADYQRY